MINIIAAIGKNRELGQNNKLLWHIPEDMDRFKKLTSGQVVIMGRKTYESLPAKFQPLPNRVNIVISHHPELISRSQKASLLFCLSMVAAIAKAKEFNKEIFIIGGSQIYNLGIKYANKLFLTLVDREYPEADAFFPDYSEFKEIINEERRQNEKYSFTFLELVKKPH